MPRLDISDRMSARAARRTRSIAAMTLAVSLGLVTSVRAADLLTETGSAGDQVSLTSLANAGGFTFGFYHVQVSGGCSTCMTYTLPNGVPTSGGSLSVVSSPFNFISDPPITNDPTENNQSAIPFGSSAPGVYVEQFGGFGTVTLGTGVINSSNILGGGSNFEGFTVYATPGASTATFEFDLDQFATSSLLSLPAGPLYLDITGTTASPVALTDLTPGQNPDFLTFSTPLAVDFTVTLTDTPFSPIPMVGGGGGGVPEPMTWTLMFAGFASVGVVLRLSRHRVASALAT